MYIHSKSNNICKKKRKYYMRPISYISHDSRFIHRICKRDLQCAKYWVYVSFYLYYVSAAYCIILLAIIATKRALFHCDSRKRCVKFVWNYHSQVIYPCRRKIIWSVHQWWFSVEGSYKRCIYPVCTQHPVGCKQHFLIGRLPLAVYFYRHHSKI